MQELTELQKEKALQVMERKKQQEKAKRRAFCDFIEFQMTAQETCLPYKVIKDLKIKERSGEFVEVMPNRFYPAPGMSLEACYALKGLMGIEFNTPLWEQQAKESTELEKACYQWDLETDRGIERWQYYMARFLMGYDLDTFRNSDWTGQSIPAHKVEEIKEFYKAVQQNCRDRPQEFYLEENPRLAEHLRKYDCPYNYI